MLSKEAHANRKWGHLPALRKILEHLPVPNVRENPILSTSDSESESLCRNMELALTVLENTYSIADAATKEEAPLVSRDLENLEHQLMSNSRTFRMWAELVADTRRGIMVRAQEAEQSPPGNP